ncbi:uncharacterized protein LOC116207783 [Punica granatum]|uniref:Uncharacterized protein LOC116207783 n=1 Tax=Punica granatum TaxID=22663 RepID=A0A6P8DWQ6_PUNGR|nr:uncharacterized protein LOC116207783 [Punica granatum]
MLVGIVPDMCLLNYYVNKSGDRSLPDHILILILSLLTMKEAIRNLQVFVWVNQVLAMHQAPTLDYFAVCFHLESSHSADIDSWIQFAVEKGVKHLKLDCCHFYDNLKDCPNYSFQMLQPRFLSSVLLLKSLSQDYVDVTSEQLACFLSTCKLLETLRLSRSWTPTYIHVVGPDPLRLKFMDISVLWILTFHLNWAPQLVDLVMAGREYPMPFAFPTLSRYFAQLQSLQSSSPQGDHLLRRLPKMKHLKLLTLDIRDSITKYDLYELNFLVRKAPILQLLTLIGHDLKGSWPQRLITNHQHLRVVLYIGYQGLKGEDRLTLHLLGTTVSLKKLIIDFRDMLFLGRPWRFLNSEKRKIWKLRDCTEELRRIIPAGVQLVIR